MMSGDRNGLENGPSGFAGLASSVSDIEADVARFSGPVAAPAPTSPAVEGSANWQGGDSGDNRGDGNSSGRTGVVITLGFVVIIIALAIWSASRTGDGSSPADFTDNASLAEGSPVEELQEETAEAAGPARLVEEMPPVGAGQLLHSDQIRYCLAEGIRVDAAGTVVSNYNQSEVDSFNAMVADYNSRCAEFRYTSSSMASARADVEAHRSELELAGRERVASASGTNADPDYQVTSTEPGVGDFAQTPAGSGSPTGFQPSTAGSTTVGGTGTPFSQPAPQLTDPPPRTWSSITAAERAAAEAACTAEKAIGPYTHNSCLMAQIARPGR